MEGAELVMSRPKMSIVFWVVIFAILAVVDVFFTPYFMNHAHGMMRMFGFAVSALIFWPIGMILFRIYQRVRVFLLTKGI
jgi:hypothetical protein